MQRHQETTADLSLQIPMHLSGMQVEEKQVSLYFDLSKPTHSIDQRKVHQKLPLTSKTRCNRESLLYMKISLLAHPFKLMKSGQHPE